jgi:hypothetical protein
MASPAGSLGSPRSGLHRMTTFRDGGNAFCVDNGFILQGISLRARSRVRSWQTQVRVPYPLHTRHVRGSGTFANAQDTSCGSQRARSGSVPNGKVNNVSMSRLGRSPYRGNFLIPFKLLHDAPIGKHHFSLGDVNHHHY